MTRVSLTRCKDRYTILCSGHASGSPEMCAAVSCLAYTIAGWARNAEGVEVLEERLEDGIASLDFRGGDECATVFDLAAVGFLQLEASNPALLSLAVNDYS